MLRDHTKALPARQRRCAAGVGASPRRARSRPRSASGFPLRNKGDDRVPSEQIRFQKIPNLKAFPRRFSPDFTNGETMGSAASSLPSQTAGASESGRPRLTVERLARRARQRRQIQSMIGACFVLDAVVLMIYAHAEIGRAHV